MNRNMLKSLTQAADDVERWNRELEDLENFWQRAKARADGLREMELSRRSNGADYTTAILVSEETYFALRGHITQEIARLTHFLRSQGVED
jgi:hypothetical protein